MGISAMSQKPNIFISFLNISQGICYHCYYFIQCLTFSVGYCKCPNASSLPLSWSIYWFTTKKNSLKCKIDCLLPKYLHTGSLSPGGWDSVPFICILYSPWPALKTSTALPWALGPMNSFSFLCPENITLSFGTFFTSALTVDFLLCSPYLPWPQTFPNSNITSTWKIYDHTSHQGSTPDCILFHSFYHNVIANLPVCPL